MAQVDLEPELVRLDVPTLIVTGDEDEPCLELALFMKRKIPTAGLVVLPESGRTNNGSLTARPTPSTAPRTGCPWPRRGR